MASVQFREVDAIAVVPFDDVIGNIYEFRQGGTKVGDAVHVAEMGMIHDIGVVRIGWVSFASFVLVGVVG